MDDNASLLQQGSYTPLLLTQQSHKLLELEVNVLNRNNHEAAHNRKHFEEKNILALNLVSSPGAGKTTLLEKTIAALRADLPFYVIEGDQQTTLDAQRIEATGAPVMQINTGKACHLDAHMIHHAIHHLDPAASSIVMIENVGNLVCPALFDLGEKYRVVIMSVTEGEDKPIKYPYMFESADLCIFNKTDLLPYVSFDMNKAKKYALSVNHQLKFIELSATSGEGMELWYQWLVQERYSILI